MLRATAQRFFHRAIAVRKSFSTRTNIDYESLKEGSMAGISKLMEFQQNEIFLEQIRERNLPKPSAGCKTLEDCEISAEDYRTIITAGLCTQALHTESRIAAMLGLGFYTIGPCGEELLGAIGCHLETSDPVALHYRHLATSIVRHLRAGKSIEEIILARARGYAVSTNDPVTGGKHCALGGLENDFLVTSTLASQAPPAVGRALGGSLSNVMGMESKFGKKFVSYVSVGDGSVNNAHFLSALNLAEYATHRKFYCPTVFGISDNNISISLPGYGWLYKFLKKLQMPVFQCNGTDLLDVMDTSRKAITHARRNRSPAALVISNLPRRFGHAATDRQSAYYTPEEISKNAATNPLATACAQAIENGVYSYSQIEKMYDELTQITQESFQQAINEPKIESRETLIRSNSQPLAPIPKQSEKLSPEVSGSRMVMRKHMTQVIDESLRINKNMVYLGEDVKHGGYYLVTEDLHAKYPDRIRDFPPDETTLIGCGMGFAQSGLLPVVEIPYAKYLDCGADMFYEAAISNWLSDGKAPIGMVFRLQGFDKGVFGGNFHTHNVIPTPCGIDVVCYSNGEDYVRGFRHALLQAKNGRIVMSVDSTNLLYLRDLHERDDSWRRAYPQEGEMMTFDQVVHYGEGKKLAIVAYGNSLYTALQAKKILEDKHGYTGITVIDSPYLSDVPAELRDDIGAYDNVLFADVCKEGQGPLAQIATKLHVQKRLGNWSYVASAPTYNPLGTTVTFLSIDDIVNSVKSM